MNIIDNLILISSLKAEGRSIMYVQLRAMPNGTLSKGKYI